jgi:hypothetical protein
MNAKRTQVVPTKHSYLSLVGVRRNREKLRVHERMKSSGTIQHHVQPVKFF